MYIQQFLQWKNQEVWRNNELLFQSQEAEPADICVDMYRKTSLNYSKFFKMDLLSKVAFLAASQVLPKEIKQDKNKIALVISSKSGCLQVDKKYDESRATIASPALFVYTLPNIMLGEICIAHEFKGEQMCTLSPKPDIDWFDFYVGDLIQNRGTEGVLCGHAEATEAGIEAVLAWVTQQPSPIPFQKTYLENIFSKIK